MKKITIFVLIMINCFILTGCNRYYNITRSSISEIRYNIFNGDSDNFNITFMSGQREKDYVVNGYNTDLIDFGIVTITIKNPNLSEPNNPTFALTIDTLRHEGVLERNPFDGTYVADIETIVDNNLPSISIKVFMGDNIEELQLTNISYDWKVSCYDALKLSCKELSQELKPLTQKEFLGEVYIKIIKDTIINDGNYYWYVNFVSRNWIYHSTIINPLTSEILAKK